MTKNSIRSAVLSGARSFAAASFVAVSMARLASAELPEGFRSAYHSSHVTVEPFEAAPDGSLAWRMGTPAGADDLTRLILYYQFVPHSDPRWKHALWGPRGWIELGDYWGRGAIAGRVHPVLGRDGTQGSFEAQDPPIISHLGKTPAELTLWAWGRFLAEGKVSSERRFAVVRSMGGKPQVVLSEGQGLPWVDGLPFSLFSLVTAPGPLASSTPPVLSLDNGDVLIFAQGTAFAEAAVDDRHSTGIWRVTPKGETTLLLTDRWGGEWRPTFDTDAAVLGLRWKLVGEPAGTKWIVAAHDPTNSIIAVDAGRPSITSIHSGYSTGDPTDVPAVFAARITAEGNLIGAVRREDGTRVTRIELPNNGRLAAVWSGSGDRLYIAGVCGGAAEIRKVGGIEVRSTPTERFAIWSVDSTGELRELSLPRQMDYIPGRSQTFEFVRASRDSVLLGKTGARVEEAWLLGPSSATSVCKLGDMLPTGQVTGIAGIWGNTTGDFCAIVETSRLQTDPPERVKETVCIGGNGSDRRVLFSTQSLARNPRYIQFNILDFDNTGDIQLELRAANQTLNRGSLSVRRSSATGER